MIDCPRVSELFASINEAIMQKVKSNIPQFATISEKIDIEEHFKYLFNSFSNINVLSNEEFSKCIDLLLITPEYTNGMAKRLTEKFSEKLETILKKDDKSQLPVNRIFLLYSLFLISQETSVASDCVEFLYSLCPSCPKGVIDLFPAIEKMNKTIPNVEFQVLFLESEKYFQDLFNSFKAVNTLPCYMATAKIGGILISSLNKQLKLSPFYLTAAAKIIKTNPFVLLYTNIDTTKNFDIVDTPPLSVVALTNTVANPEMLTLYKRVFTEILNTLTIPLFTEKVTPNEVFSEVYNLFNNISQGDVYYDALAIVLEHFLRSMYLLPFFENIKKCIVGNKNEVSENLDGIRQLYICILVCGLNGHATPSCYSFLSTHRKTLLKLINEVCDIFKDCALGKRSIEFRNALALYYVPDQALIQRSFTLILASDIDEIFLKNSQIVLDQFSRSLSDPAAVVPFLEFAYVYLQKLKNGDLNAPTALEILCSVEQISYPKIPKFAAWRSLIRSTVLEKVSPIGVLLLAGKPSSVSPTHLIGALSYIDALLSTNQKCPYFESFINQHPNFIAEMFEVVMTSELPSATYLICDLISILKSIQRKYLMESFINLMMCIKGDYSVRKTLRIFGVLSTVNTNNLEFMYKKIKELSKVDNSVLSYKISMLIAALYACYDPRVVTEVIDTITSSITKDNSHYAYCLLIYIAMKIPGFSLNEDVLNALVDYGEKNDFIEVIKSKQIEANEGAQFFLDMEDIYSVDSWVRELTCSAYLSE